jgi:hypothetical protein
MIFKVNGGLKITLMKTCRKLTLISLSLLVIFSSCFKDDISRNKVFLTQNIWQFDKYGLDENNNGSLEESENIMLPCEADDRFYFFISGAGFFERNELSCAEGEPDIINFRWSFSNNETELAIFAAPEKINRLDDNILEVYYIDVNSVGEPVKFIRRFRH